jgi:hypothetical protein
MQAGEEVFVDYGLRDSTDHIVGFGHFGGEDTGVFVPVQLDRDPNGALK